MTMTAKVKAAAIPKSAAPAASKLHGPPRLSAGRSHQAIQAKLAVGAVDDPLEREADRVADTVMSGGAAPTMTAAPAAAQRKCSACDADEEHAQPLRRKEQSAASATPAAAPPIVGDVLASQGVPLDAATRAYFEPRFGRDLGGVRVHTDARADRSARAVGALAYTVGNDVVFAAGRHAPATEAGRRLLAHELAHVAQQVPGRLMRFQPAEAEVEPEVEEEAEEMEAEPGPSGHGHGRGARYAAPPRTLQGMMDRAAREADREQAIFELERPVATLTRGGTAPDFVTVGAPQQAMGNFGTVTFRPHLFHVLDAIEFHVSRVNTEDDLFDILERFIPSPMDLMHPQRRFGRSTPTAAFLSPMISDSIDPRGEQRLRVYAAALTQRTQAVPALANSRARPATLGQSMQNKGCRLIPLNRPLGNDPLSEIFCQVATGSGFSYRIQSPEGIAEIDALRGSTWFECKCGYKPLMDALRRGRWWGRQSLDGLTEQVLRHRRIATACGLQYRYMVSNQELADFLRVQWSGIDIMVQPFSACEEGQ